MANRTRAYFGDGVYAEFNGIDIVLTANGVGDLATDRIYVEPAMLEAMVAWERDGYRDHTTGRRFGVEDEQSPNG